MQQVRCCGATPNHIINNCDQCSYLYGNHYGGRMYAHPAAGYRHSKAVPSAPVVGYEQLRQFRIVYYCNRFVAVEQRPNHIIDNCDQCRHLYGNHYGGWMYKCPGSGVSAPKSTPVAPVVTVVNNCGNSVLSTTAAGSLLWSNGQTTSSITVTNAATYTVKTTVNGCTSGNGSGTSAPKALPSALLRYTTNLHNNHGNHHGHFQQIRPQLQHQRKHLHEHQWRIQ